MRIKRRTRRKVLILRAMTSTKVSIWFLLLWAVRLELRTWHIHVLARKCKKEHSLLNLARRELLSWCTPPNSNRVLIWWNAITCRLYPITLKSTVLFYTTIHNCIKEKTNKVNCLHVHITNIFLHGSKWATPFIFSTFSKVNILIYFLSQYDKIVR